MKVIIIEDEKPAAEKLYKALTKPGSNIEVLAILGNIKESVSWLKNNPGPELIFMDIELTDGLSFKIFEQAPVSCPVIFITAYDEYWQEAFEHSSIDYLLKPLKQDKLEAALNKYEKLKQYFASNFKDLVNWHRQPQGNGFKKRFLVKRGTDYISVRAEDIAYFYAAHKLVCLVDNKNQKFILDQSLADIEKHISSSLFYRVNRKYLVNMGAIKRIKSYPKSKLQLELDPPVNEEIVISQENAAAFKEWMGR
ncbi:MAG: LytTR family DNA-binding domain-containing protein [Chitinophagaceae bacterium]|nr:LytTR family DNA-binding domain-containing protein [Chitinophagaceae bacterium]